MVMDRRRLMHPVPGRIFPPTHRLASAAPRRLVSSQPVPDLRKPHFALQASGLRFQERPEFDRHSLSLVTTRTPPHSPRTDTEGRRRHSASNEDALQLPTESLHVTGK